MSESLYFFPFIGEKEYERSQSMGKSQTDAQEFRLFLQEELIRRCKAKFDELLAGLDRD